MEIQVPTIKASGHLHPHHLQSLPLPCPSKGLGQARSIEGRAALTRLASCVSATDRILWAPPQIPRSRQSRFCASRPVYALVTDWFFWNPSPSTPHIT